MYLLYCHLDKNTAQLVQAFFWRLLCGRIAIYREQQRWPGFRIRPGKGKRGVGTLHDVLGGGGNDQYVLRGARVSHS